MGDGGGRPGFVVECYWPGVNGGILAVATRRVCAAAADLRRAGHAVEFIGSVLVPHDETVFCLFEGPETNVRAASEQAGLPFERILESVRMDGGVAP
jgi:Protein of unknown function (DUF4242)